jgi:RND family efflux transporter MFP subunit
MAESRVKAASQAKKEVESQFAYTNIKAPISGVVVQKMANEGDLASPGMPLLKIESNRNLKVVARIPESQIASIKIGDQAKIEIKAINKSLEAFVDEIAPSASFTGGQYLIKLKLMEQQESLFSGMFATVYLKSKEEKTENIFMIPKSAIVQQGQLSGVYTVNDENKALLRWLRLGRTSGNMVEVLAGLSPDEQYIASSTGKLYNGVPVVTQ